MVILSEDRESLLHTLMSPSRSVTLGTGETIRLFKLNTVTSSLNTCQFTTKHIKRGLNVLEISFVLARG